MASTDTGNSVQRDELEYDVVIVGAGPAGLAAAIRLKQLAASQGSEVSVCVLDKAAEIGGHILSGAIMDPKALNELIPDWQERGAPLDTPVNDDRFLFLTERRAWRIPGVLLPAAVHNGGNYAVSLSDVVKWLGNQAQEAGVDLFPGFAATDVLYTESAAVGGVLTGDMGVGKTGSRGTRYQAGIALRARYTLFCEGARGHLGLRLMDRYALRANSDPQTYGLGIKEIWEVPPQQHRAGLVLHTLGWPLDASTQGGGFLYHLDRQRVAVGLVVSLAYRNPFLSPFDEFQRLKCHPSIRRHLENGRRLAYGARAIAAGGLNSLPALAFPGGALAGCDAGFLDSLRLKGSHTAIKSGMLAAQAAYEALQEGRRHDVLSTYPEKFEQSWLHADLSRARNVKQWLGKNLYLGALMTGVEQKLLGGRFPWTLRNRIKDRERTQCASKRKPILYPAPDGRLVFDRLSSVHLANINHESDQPVHLTLKDTEVPALINKKRYAALETRYCPAGVYEFIDGPGGSPRLQINTQNCVHCKTCDIKDPTGNIVWVAPEGGSGPNYSGM
ncbi:Electron transfer flavoprotein-ubiquinone oxidoreductase [Bordetella sputigena]|uniref:electron transfer flavoprotein-ubiquinone oxidoreductase n=1 Tax=Bordetella sputigena TaxID=1416810 RepID=UPI0039EE8FF7